MVWSLVMVRQPVTWRERLRNLKKIRNETESHKSVSTSTTKVNLPTAPRNTSKLSHDLKTSPLLESSRFTARALSNLTDRPISRIHQRVAVATTIKRRAEKLPKERERYNTRTID